MPFVASREILYGLAPLIITIPLYILGRRLFFKNVKQSEMHLSTPRRLFTLTIALIHIIMILILFFTFEQTGLEF